MITDDFTGRHIGPDADDIEAMLKKTGCSSLEELIDQTVPSSIRLKEPLKLPKGINEYEYLCHLRQLASKNKIYKTYIGLGYYNTITPGVILRNVLENPGWYTSYTPYQAEISQGRLEALLNFQTMISDLTAMPVANASLLDEGTAAAEAMIMLFNTRPKEQVKAEAVHFFVSEGVFPHTLDVLKTRAWPLGIKIVTGDWKEFTPGEKFFGVMLQYPDQFGNAGDFERHIKSWKEKGVPTAVAADLLSLTILTPPGEWDADIVVGSSQRFGIPMGFGGPHAGFFATTEKYKRSIPGRIIGISKDASGNPAFRMALQTREQHIKRERATSNICTAQALLAIMAGLYAMYHGPCGLKRISEDIHRNAVLLSNELLKYGFTNINEHYFDTLYVKLPEKADVARFRMLALKNEMNFRYFDNTAIGISLDETTSLRDVEMILRIIAAFNSKPFREISGLPVNPEVIPEKLQRKTPYLTHEIFNSCHSETEMMRYLKKLENKDLALNRTMIPLGSCTMKLNAAAEMFPLSWPEFAGIHPFVPGEQAEGYLEMIRKLDEYLCEITGFRAISFQPNSGASGEYTGLLLIKRYLESNGMSHRDICLIPASAHGTNPASSIMAGFQVVVVKSDESGNIDINDLQAKVSEYASSLAALMVTYPSTHGVYEEDIKEIIEMVHKAGGQVYMDGANMNAQVGITNPGIIGADVCHLNLHKTFAIPHGGGGPGVGPVGVAAHLAPFLPGHTLVKTGGKKAISAVSSAPFGSAMILPISYGYIKLLGGEGLLRSTQVSILNANYLKSSLAGTYQILYTGKNGRVAHEMILNCNEFSKTAGISVSDIAKRLMDYGFHAPTVAFPVHGTLMVEPTESEPLNELNRFIDAMIKIRQEIADIENGNADKENNVIRNAPHTADMVCSDEWDYPYSRQKATFQGTEDKNTKYWPPVTRIDDAFGDRNLVCTCYSFTED
ncbi:MAG: aminomethyl-transferring glycine dehydrogenase [Bacteroidales bacterium]|nr:aminomethyl-transferring glycine dehydrogenase [Bacteroidales bacterium]